jgi:hypothetical protein
MIPLPLSEGCHMAEASRTWFTGQFRDSEMNVSWSPGVALKTCLMQTGGAGATPHDLPQSCQPLGMALRLVA